MKMLIRSAAFFAAMLCLGYVIAIAVQGASGASHPVPFTRAFHEKYSAAWFTTGLVAVLAILAHWVRFAFGLRKKFRE